MRKETSVLNESILPRVINSLIKTNTRQSPSIKTVELIIYSLSDVCCYSIASLQTPTFTFPASMLAHIDEIFGTILNTLRNSPSSVGVCCVVALARLILAGCKMVRP